jgi:hypothetical protein
MRLRLHHQLRVRRQPEQELRHQRQEGGFRAMVETIREATDFSKKNWNLEN